MTKLSEILSLDELQEAVRNGYISERFHPAHQELAILNYTEKAAYEKHWNDSTLTCRGLIYNVLTEEVLARPFKKFFNWDEPQAPGINWDAPLYHVANKEDGSLGIIFETPYGIGEGEWTTLQVATRGSFVSEQAEHANAWLRDGNGSGKFLAWAWDRIDAGYTPLVEIIYAENRIVLDYGSRDELIPLGSVEISTGVFAPYLQR